MTKPSDEARRGILETVKGLLADGQTLEAATRAVGLTEDAYKALKAGRKVDLKPKRPKGRRPVALGGKRTPRPLDGDPEPVEDLLAEFDQLLQRLRRALGTS